MESRWASKQCLNASPAVIWMAFDGKYLKYRSYPSLPRAPTSPGVPYILVISDRSSLGTVLEQRTLDILP